MKTWGKVLVLFAAIFAFGMVAGCKNDDDGSSVAAEFEDSSWGAAFVFYGDSTAKGTYVMSGIETVIFDGTYDGEPSKDGDVMLIAKAAGLETKTPITISNGTFTFGSYTFKRK